MRKRVAENAAQLARDGAPRQNVYLTGKVGELGIALHSEGDRLVVTRGDGSREEVELSRAEGEMNEPLAVSGVLPPARGTEDDEREWAPGTSPLDDDLPALRAALQPEDESDSLDDDSFDELELDFDDDDDENGGDA